MRRCNVCKHPEKLRIEEMLLRKVPLRKIGEDAGLTIACLFRHRQHLPEKMVAAERAREVSEASTLLDRVETLVAECREIGAAAKKGKNWPAALSALREVRGCLELLGRLNGELQAAASFSLHKHLHLNGAGSASMPTSEHELDLAIAEHVRQATNDFDPAEIARLRALLRQGAVLEAGDGARDYESSALVAVADNSGVR